ncbi:MAG TPA: hypothetical protein VF994_02805 [Myxococcales bacterium]
MQTPSPVRARQQKLARIRLVARVQLAYEQLRDLASRAGAQAASDPAIQAARRHLTALNLSLALLTLQAD